MKATHLVSSLTLVVSRFSSVVGFTPLRLGNELHTITTPSSSFHSNDVMDVVQQYHPPTLHLSHHNNKRTTALHASPLDIASALYNQALLTNPLETKLATGGILALAGDAIAQSREDADYDVKRAGAFISFDIFYRAVQCALFPEIIRICDGHYLGSFLSVMPLVEVDTDVLATLEQTMFNQFLVIPFLYYPVFFTLTGYMQGLSLDATIERVSTTIVPLLKRNWTFWIPVQYFQFGYVDEPLQIPFLCVVGLAWTFILSLSAGSVKKNDVESTEDVIVIESNNNGELMLTENRKEGDILVVQNVTVSV